MGNGVGKLKFDKYYIYLVVSVIYLVFEIFFNNKLINVVSGAPSRDDIENLELVGRGMSSFGLAMFIWSIRKPNILKPIVFGTYLVIAVTIFISQKWIVDDFVRTTSGSDRHASLTSLLAKQSMLSNQKLISEHFNADSDSEKKAILAMSGMFGLYSNQVEYIMGNPSSSIKSYANRMYSDNRDEYYNAYQNYSKTSYKVWEEYARAGAELQSVKDNAGETANRIWVDSGAQDKLDKLFRKYKSKRKSALLDVKNYPGNIGALFKGQLFARVVNCKDARCVEKIEQSFSKQQRRKLLGENIEFYKFCEKNRKASNPIITVKYDDEWQSRTKTSKYGKGVKFITDHNLYCDFRRDALIENSTVKRLLKKKIDNTMGDFRGMPLNIETYDDFVKEKAVQDIIKKQLRSKGITEFDRNFDVSTQKRAVNSIKNAIIRTSNKGGASSIPKGLTYEQFMKNRNAHKMLDEKVCGIWKKGLPNDLTKVEYDKAMGRENISCTQRDIKRHLKQGKNELAPGGSDADSGEFYAKLALVPALAAILSLLAIVLNSLSLIFSISKHSLGHRLAKTRKITLFIIVSLIIIIPLSMEHFYSNTFESGKIFLGMKDSISIYIPVLYYLAFEPLLLKYTYFLYALSAIAVALIFYMARRSAQERFIANLKRPLGKFNFPKINSNKTPRNN